MRFPLRSFAIGVALIAGTGAVFSQSLPLSGLTSGTTVTGSDLFYDVQAVGQGGVKVTGTQVKTFILSSPTFTGTLTFPDNATWGTAGISIFTAQTGTLAKSLTAQTVTVTGLTSASSQCLHALSTGIVSGTGSDCSSSGTPGGSNTQVQFNNSGAFAGDSGFTVATPGQVTLALGTLSANAKALNITGTWNNGSTTFDAPLFVNITTSGFGSNSTLVDFQASGASLFQILPNSTNSTNFGEVLVPPGISGVGPGLGFLANTVTGTASFQATGFSANYTANGASNFGVYQSGTLALNFSQSQTASSNKIVRFPSDWTFGWASIPSNLAGSDTGISRDNAAVIDIGNGTQGDKSGTIQAKQGTFLTITAATATLFMGSNSVTAMSLSPTIVFYGQSNPGANETYAVCAGSGATSLTAGGQVFVDTTTCLASSMLTKHSIAAFNDYGMTKLASLAEPLSAERRLASAPIEIDPIAEAMALIPVVATYDTIDDNPQFTLIAQNACQVDERLCERTRDGSVRSFRPNSVISILVAAFQKQQKEIEELRLKVESRR